MLIFAGIGMAGFLLLLIVWLWILPDGPKSAKKWLWIALLLTFVGLVGTIIAAH